MPYKNRPHCWLFISLFIAAIPLSNLYSQQMEVEGDVDANGHQIKNVAEPTDPQHLATKAYIEGKLIQLGLSLGSTGVQGLLDVGISPLALLQGGVEKDSLYGKTYQGGLIFYLDDQDSLPGIQGMVAAPMDQSSGADWGCYGASIGGQKTGIGSGIQNTLIMNQICMSSQAANVCSNLVLDGYSDWFLPSRDELEQMYLKIGQGAPAPNTNIGGFVPERYWSSVQFSGNDAWTVRFSDGLLSYISKTGGLDIRAARAF